MEVSTEADVCMLAIMNLEDKYFAQSSSGALQVEISGEVTVSMANRQDGNLRTEGDTAKLHFAHTINLTPGDGDDDDDEDNADLANENNEVDGAASVYGIASGLVLVASTMI